MRFFDRIARFMVPIITIARELQRFNRNIEALMSHFGVSPPPDPKELRKMGKPEPASVMMTNEDDILVDELRGDLGYPPLSRED